MRITRTRAAVVASFVPLMMAAACSSNDTPPDRLYIMSSTERGPAGNRPPVPTAAQLDEQLKALLNPAVSDDERLKFIEDGGAFRSAIPDLFNAMRQHPNAVYFVSDPVFDNHDGTITAAMKLDRDNTGYFQTAQVHFVAIDGIWKVSRTDLCGLLSAAQYRLAGCA